MDILTFRRIAGKRVVDFGPGSEVFPQSLEIVFNLHRIDAPLCLMVKVLGRFLSSRRP